MGLEVKLRRGESVSVLTEDGHEMFVEAIDIGSRRVLLSFSGSRHFQVSRISRGLEPNDRFTGKLGDDASHASYLRRIIERNQKREGE